MEWLIWDLVNKELEDTLMINANLQWFMEIRSRQTNLIYFLMIISLVDKGNSVNVIYWDFCKAFDLIPHDILIKNLEEYKITWHRLNGLKTG